MQTTLSGVLLLALIGSVGCGGNDTVGGPRPRAPYERDYLYGPSDKTFDLTCPPTNMTQGQTRAVVFRIKRYTTREYDVTLEFSNVPQGVTIDPTQPVIRHGEAETKVDLLVAEDSAPGEFAIKVVGHPTTGADCTSELHVTVSKDPDVEVSRLGRGRVAPRARQHAPKPFETASSAVTSRGP